MFVYCRDCKWAQDDFYSIDGYNPAKFLMNYNKDLCGDIDRKIRVNDGKIEITMREHIASFYEDFARRIREMKWITVKEFYADQNKACPKCGSTNLVID